MARCVLPDHGKKTVSVGSRIFFPDSVDFLQRIQVQRLPDTHLIQGPVGTDDVRRDRGFTRHAGPFAAESEEKIPLVFGQALT